jgi:hypothetical protein
LAGAAKATVPAKRPRTARAANIFFMVFPCGFPLCSGVDDRGKSC